MKAAPASPAARRTPARDRLPRRDASPFPFRAACIDAGSNAIRFRAVVYESPKRFTLLDSARAQVRLGREVFRVGRLSERLMRAALSALSEFRGRMDALGVQGYRAVATSAVREAANSRDFLARIHERTGLVVDPIDAVEEARLVHLAVRERVPMGRRTWFLGDLGGGSLQISLVTGSRILWTLSRPVGAVRLAEAIAAGADSFARLRTAVAGQLPVSLIPVRTPLAGCIATGGGIETLAGLVGAPRDPRGVVVLPVDGLSRLTLELSRLSVRQRSKELGLPPDRADIILPAAVVWSRLAKLLNADAFLVPAVGVPDGVLRGILARLLRER